MHNTKALSAVFLLTLTCAQAATILIGGPTLNGDLNADTSATDQRTFADTPDWTNLGGPQTAQATRTNLGNDATRNAVLTQDNLRLFGNATAYQISSGDVFDISYEWRDASGWQDAFDRVRVTLFTTADDTIGGTRTVLTDTFSELSAVNSTWQSENFDAAYTATAADADKFLFLEFAGWNGDGDGTPQTGNFGRFDNLVLEVTAVPEPSLGLLAALGLLSLGRRRR